MQNKELERLRLNLPLPTALLKMIDNGRWQHPGDEILREKVPFIHDPLDFLACREEMVAESGPLMGPMEFENEIFSEYRGSVYRERDLPWIDCEKAIFIAVNTRPGDDVGIALDYRNNIDSPRVIGGDWHTSQNCIYREISSSFEEFAKLLNL